VCAECGDRSKPACSESPDCPYHCWADEHDYVRLVDELDLEQLYVEGRAAGGAYAIKS
jgi:hypothetical protein